MKIQVETDSKAFAGGGYLAFRKTDRLLNGKISQLIDQACPNAGVPTSKKIELLVGQTIHGHKSTLNAWQNAQQNGALKFINKKLAQQELRGAYRAIQAIGEKNPEALYESIADQALKKLGVSIAIVHEDTTSQFFTGKKADRAKRGYSRDHRPDKLQINIGIIQVKSTRFPSAYVVTPGNEHDSKLFPLLAGKHKPGTLIVADRGPASLENKRFVKGHGLHYLFGEKLSGSNRREAKASLPKMKFLRDGYQACHEKVGGEWRHYFLSEKLRTDVREKRKRNAAETIKEYEANLRKRRRQKKAKRKIQITAEGELLLVEREVITRRLFSKSPEQLFAELSKDDALDGVFVLSSDLVQDAKTALDEYKAKDEVEKVFCALKSTLHLRPFNARKKECVDGTIFVTMLSLLVVGILAFTAGIRGTAVKTLVHALQCVTLVVKNSLRPGVEKVKCLNLTGLAEKLLVGIVSVAS